MHRELEQPIPLNLPSVSCWREIPIQEGGELLVPLGPFSPNFEIFTRSIYGGEGNESPYMDKPLGGNLITMFVREKVASQLQSAQSLLPGGMHFVVFDTYRPLTVQQSLFDKYFGDLKSQHPDWKEEDLLTETQKYVSVPSHDLTKPSPHNTGGSVDLAIYQLPIDIDFAVIEVVDKLHLLNDHPWEEAYKLEMEMIAMIKQNARMLDFGIPFDWGGEEAALNYFERLGQNRELTPEEIVARDNRRLLYNVMVSAGFEPFESEWWHYNDPKTQMGARTAGLPFAEYGAINLSPANFRHETMRRGHWLGTNRMAGRTRREFGPTRFMPFAFEEAFRAARVTGDLRKSSLPEASVISPS